MSVTRKLQLWGFVALLAGSLVAAVVAGYTAYGKQLNQNAYDFFVRLRGLQPGPSDRIVIVDIDDATLHALGKLPLDRRLVAQVLDNICAANPAVVGIDIWFPEASTPEADAALEAALKRCPRSVLGTALVSESEWYEPIPAIAQSATLSGHVHAAPDEDGINRHVLLQKAAAGKQYWALAFQCFRLMQPASGRQDIPPLEDEDEVVWGDVHIPASRRFFRQREVLVNFEGRFRHFSFDKVLQGQVRPGDFAGKAVLIGTTALGVGVADIQFTPLSLAGIGMPGVEIHAHLLDTLLRRAFLVPWRDSAKVAAQLSIAILAGFALYHLRGAKLAAAIAVLALAVHLVPYGLLLHGEVVPAFSLAAAFWFPVLIGGGFQYWTVWRHFLTADATQHRLRRQMDFVTHEVRSPLTAIHGSGELMARYPLDDKRRQQMADLLQREAQRLSRMFTRFYDVERLLTGEIELRQDPVDLRAVVLTAVEHVRPFADRKHIGLEVTIDGPGGARGDAELLEFAVYNLLSNAVKYSPEESVVAVAARRERDRAIIEVRDQGPGIAPAAAARIFERFYRTESATASDKPGYGLGLMFVQEIAVHHGGAVSVESALGEGSLFRLTVPLGAHV